MGTREAQAAARKAEKERLNEEATVKPGEEPEDNGSEAPDDEPVTPPTNPDTGGEDDDDEGGLAG